MSYEISHQRLSVRFFKDYLLWRTCEKLYLKHVEFKIKKKNPRARKFPLLLQISEKSLQLKNQLMNE